MKLDVTTLFAMSLATFFIVAVIGLFYWKTRMTFPGFGHWVSCIAAMAMSMLSMLARPYSPLIISVLPANLFTVLAALLALDGCARFCAGRRIGWKWYAAALSVNFLIATYFTLADDRLDIRIASLSVICSVILGRAVGLLWGEKTSALRDIARGLAAFFVMWCSLALVRGAYWLFWPKDALLSAEFGNTVYFALTGLVMIGIAYCFIMLNNARFEIELNLANERLGRSLEDLKAAITEIKVLKGIIPVCSFCKAIRDTETDEWLQFEAYIQHHSDAHFSHSICPTCVKAHYPELSQEQSRT